MGTSETRLEIHTPVHREPQPAFSDPFGENQRREESMASTEPEIGADVQENRSIIGSEKTRSRLKIFLIMIALSLSLFISALDQTIVATATPTISAELHSGTGYVWIGGAYLIANAASSNIWANFSDIWGRKPILLSAVALFFGASIICAKAVDMSMLIAGRSIQGIAGGGLIQLITITISDLFSVRLRSLFLGLIEFIWAIAGALGPLVGGSFTETISWRWIFWINLPVCGTAFVLLFLFLDIHNPRTGVIEGIKAVDWFGSFSILGLAVMVLLGLDFGGDIFPWDSPKVICLIVFGCLMTLIFIYCEKRLAKYPLMPLGIFGKRSNIACFFVAFTHGFVFLGAEYYLPLYFQSAQEASPFRSGLLILPFVLTEAALSLAAGLIIHSTGRYLAVVWVGTTLVLLGTGLFIDYDASSSLGKIIGYQIVIGMGCGLLFFPPLLALQSNVRQDETASATATFGFIRNMAMAMSVVIGGVVFQNSMDQRKSALLASGLSSTMMEELTGSEAAANVMLIRSLDDPLQRQAVKNAYAWSMRNIWILYASLAAVGFLASAFITKQHLSQEHVETKTGLREKQSPAESRQETPPTEL
ncbi:MFS general substrate transporter [Aspergillus steynii IBT 23096]|uniref:Efflux pump dotC n=1 Tax=Aspergillus steynii IBT 23096 TaxID=1392250 RepID=A0A2I2FVZ4_9EURO|nr:MFS general substrate transporter [Aspergillus steynii IBT 23096]PLB44777.1 MFS general substrate transporter [Aspergillus steynii IBT 23096]